MQHRVLVTEKFTIKLGDGLLIRARVKTLDTNTRKPVLLISHGYKGHKELGFWPYVTHWLAKCGYYTLNFDFSRIEEGNPVWTKRS